MSNWPPDPGGSLRRSLIQAFAAAVQAFLRQHCAKRKPLRPAIVEARLVLHFEGSGGQSSWFHVSYINMQTWDVVLMALVPSDNPVSCRVADAFGQTALIARTSLPAMGLALLWTAVKAWDMHAVWRLTPWVCACSGRRSDSSVAGHVFVEPAASIGTSIIWQGEASLQKPAACRSQRCGTTAGGGRGGGRGRGAGEQVAAVDAQPGQASAGETLPAAAVGDRLDGVEGDVAFGGGSSAVDEDPLATIIPDM